MKKLLCLVLVVGSMSAFSMSNKCAKASVQKENLGVVMGVLNKNSMKYSVSKDSYSVYSVVVRSKGSYSRHVDRSVARVMSSKMMKEMGIRFRKLSSRECSEIATNVLDLSKL